MGLFDVFKKKEEPEKVTVAWPVSIAADAKGVSVPMEEIPDEVFRQGALGMCCGINPTEGVVYSPVNGKIVQIFDTLHAIGIEAEGGIEILIHVGVDTVEMNGDGFKSFTKTGVTVSKGEKLLEFDIDKVKAAGHPAVVITVVTNTDQFSSVEFAGARNVIPGDELLKVSR